MLTIKNIFVKNMKRITLIMAIILLFFSTVIQIFSMHRMSRQNALQIFGQIEQVLNENSEELKLTQKQYEAMCLNNARTVAYILKYNPAAGDSVEELKKIAANIEVDEIHIFDGNGILVKGTHPEYFGYSFDSGEQMAFFKPLLTDHSLELVQEIEPNTAEGKLVQYSALWNEDKTFIVQIGMHSDTVLRATKKNELSSIFALLGTGTEHNLYAINPMTEKVVGASIVSDVDKNLSELGFQKKTLESDNAFYAVINQTLSYCLSQEIGENRIVWTTPVSHLFSSIFINEILQFIGLILIAEILVWAVTNNVNKTVIDQIQRVNESLRAIQDGDLKTKVHIDDNKEFLELSTHINNMVDSLLQSSERLELSKKIEIQKEELEQQHQQLEAAVKRAESASKAKSEFLFNMSHDIRTPMNAILGFTNLALESDDPEAQRKYLKNIDISSKQLLDLINNILELSKIQNHKIIIEEDLVDVKETCQKLCTVFDRDLKKKHLDCSVRFLDMKYSHLYLDKTYYSRILLNLVSNAIQYTPDGGTIEIFFRELEGNAPDTCLLETTVQDNGIGMSEEFLRHVYDLFTREQTSTASGIQGSGLGLVIVKNLVDFLRGTISIESHQGKGTKVVVCLPHRLGEERTEDKSKEMETLNSELFKGKRILMAEDIDINAMIATKLLSSKGFLVERARDGVECVDMLLKANHGYYDLVLMDIQMPNMDGYRAAETIRLFEDPEKASIPILAMTANAFQEDQEKAFESGMNGHIAKPIDAAKMFQSIAEALLKSKTEAGTNI